MKPYLEDKDAVLAETGSSMEGLAEEESAARLIKDGPNRLKEGTKESLLKKEYPEIREKLWKDAFWSKSFCLLTAGGAPAEVIRSYIETQGEKIHEKGRWKNV